VTTIDSAMRQAGQHVEGALVDGEANAADDDELLKSAGDAPRLRGRLRPGFGRQHPPFEPPG
jgi:hypothetical protein